MTPTRESVLNAIVAALEQQLHVGRQAADVARDEATNAETRQESKYDTRAIEAGYLAGAQSRRLAELELTAARYARLPRSVEPRDAVDGPALVVLRDERGDTLYFVGPGAAALRVNVDGADIRVVTPSSPLGAALVGAELGDDIALPNGATYELASIA